tara:strand:+ start:34 stop:192 length:159 start_codon:yes stop_codon:yes gene_type:complete
VAVFIWKDAIGQNTLAQPAHYSLIVFVLNAQQQKDATPDTTDQCGINGYGSL